MIRLCFLSSTLDIGGAERQLLELARRIDKTRFDITVVSFHEKGTLLPEFERIDGIKVRVLKKGAFTGRWRFWIDLWNTIRELKPDILHGYLDYPNIYSLLLGRLLGAKVVWGIRNSELDRISYDWKARQLYYLNAHLSRYVDRIIINSWTGLEYHSAHGYNRKRMVVIQNGIDTKRFLPDRVAGERLRLELGIDPSAMVIGVIGRLDPIKGHLTFLQAAKYLLTHWPEVRFLCVGEGPETYKKKLVSAGESLDLAGHIIWAGPRQDMSSVYNALDIFTSASYGEGFSNAIGEAMACAIPCVVTDVGDSKQIMGETGIVIPAKDAAAMEQAWCSLFALGHDARRNMGVQARDRVQRKFGLDDMIAKSEKVLAELIPGSIVADIVKYLEKE